MKNATVLQHFVAFSERCTQQVLAPLLRSCPITDLDALIALSDHVHDGLCTWAMFCLTTAYSPHCKIATSRFQLHGNKATSNSSRASLALHCVPKKHVTTSTMITRTVIVRLQYFWHTYYWEYRPSTGVFIVLPYLFHVPTVPWETVKT